MISANLATNLIQGKIASSLIDEMSHKIRKNIKYAAKKGLELEVEAGNQINLAIEKARVAYVDSLNLTIEKVDQLFKKHLLELQQMVDQFEEIVQNGTEDISQVALGIKEASLIFPFSNKQPLLTSIFPKTVVYSSSDRFVRFVFNGTFMHAGQPGFTPTFKILEQAFAPSQNLIQELVFLVPSNTFALSSRSETPLVEGRLIVPWNKAMIGSTPAEATYQLLFEVLPESPGVIKFEMSVPCPKRSTRPITREFSFSSSTKPYQMLVTPNPGWWIDGNTAKVHFIEGGNLVERNEVIYNRPNQIYYKVHPKKSKPIRAKVEFQEYQDVVSQENHSDKFALKWGDVKQIPIPKDANWKLNFTDHVGTEHTATSSELKTQFLDVVLEESGISIKVKGGNPRKKNFFSIPSSKL